MSYTPEQERLLTELAELQAELDAALDARTKWMDEHMADFAAVPIGEDLYDLSSGNYLGRVTELYRYWAKRDPRYDTKMHIDYRYDSHGFSGNTSSRGSGHSFGTREQAARILANRARMLAVE